MNILKVLGKFPWWRWLVVIAVIIVGWQLATGASYSKKLWNMVMDQIAEDKGRVVEIQAENQRWYEETIVSLQAKLEASNKIIKAKDSEILALRRERETLTTSSNPDDIVRDLHKLGYGSERRVTRHR